MTSKLKVPSTSRLVLEHAIKLYDTPLQQAYINAIDFSETSRISRDIGRAYPLISDAVYYRKQCVRGVIHENIMQHKQLQVIILGAGLDPLSLFLLENYPGLISNIFEVDNGYIEEKKQIYEEILHVTGDVQFIRCDITDTVLLLAKLEQHGYRPEEPALIIFEGVLHYISNEEFVQIMQLFGNNKHHNLVVLDFMLTKGEVPDNHLVYYRNALAVMEAYLNRPFNMVTRKTMLELISRSGGTLERLEPLNETEKKLTGSNRCFYQPGHGIVEMAVFRL